MNEFLIKALNLIKKKFYIRWNLWRLHNYKGNISLPSTNKPQIYGSFFLRIKKSGTLIFGENVDIKSNDAHNPLGRNIKTSIFVDKDAKIAIGNNVGISCASIRAHQLIQIGNNVDIGADTIIMDSDGHSLNYLDRKKGSGKDQINKKNKPIVIEDDVLIGARSIILKGVTIGARSIIGAGSVVSRSIPADEIWAGNPAKFIKKINNE